MPNGSTRVKPLTRAPTLADQNPTTKTSLSLLDLGYLPLPVVAREEGRRRTR